MDLNQMEQQEVFVAKVLEKKVKGIDGTEKKISDIIDIDKHIWNSGGKIIFKHEAIQRLAHFVGAKMLEPKLIVEPSTMNGQAYVFLCSFEFPDGEISTEIGESNQYNTTSISRMYPASVAFKRGYDRAFLRSNYMNLFDVFSDVESDAFIRDVNSDVKQVNNEDILNEYAEIFGANKEKNTEQQEVNVVPNNVAENTTPISAEPSGKPNNPAMDEIDTLIATLSSRNQENVQQKQDSSPQVNTQESIQNEEQPVEGTVVDVKKEVGKDEEISDEELTHEDIMEQMKADDLLLRLPETDEKYPNKHIVKDIIKEHNDFEYLTVIKNKYPKNKYYQNMINMLLQATQN